MGAEVIIFGQSLKSHFLKGLTHSALTKNPFPKKIHLKILKKMISFKILFNL